MLWDVSFEEMTYRGGGDEALQVGRASRQCLKLTLQGEREHMNVALQRLTHVEEPTVRGTGPDEHQGVRDLDFQGPRHRERHLHVDLPDVDLPGREG